MEKLDVAIKTPFIKLSALLKLSGIASTGGEASIILEEGLVLYKGEVTVQRGKKIYPGDVVIVETDPAAEIAVVAE